ncbi:MAG: hypothetical protein H6755_01960 [Candidatus Omnitrophica bacterium]|nr:hypothetical protein [Candidatus Omnitrophota bacterium]MCB9747153.1 hypothetical protein [Candidatus Omnitrophota bacterium]
MLIKIQNCQNKKKSKSAQSAIEYLLLLAVVVSIVLVGFNKYLPRTYNAAQVYFNRASVGVLGDGPRCGDGTITFGETPETCCVDFGSCGSFVN